MKDWQVGNNLNLIIFFMTDQLLREHKNLSYYEIYHKSYKFSKKNGAKFLLKQFDYQNLHICIKSQKSQTMWRFKFLRTLGTRNYQLQKQNCAVVVK